MSQQIAFSRTDLNHSFTYTNASGQEVTQTRTIVGTIFVPDAPGTYPVVFYSHGHGGSPAAGAATNARALADQGYIVVAPRHLDSLANPQAISSAFPVDDPASTLHRIADIRFLVDVLPNLMAGVPGYSADANRAAIAGHSHGAFAAALLAGAQSFKAGLDAVTPGNEFGLTEIADERFKEAILLSPQGAAGAGSTFGFTDESWDGVTIPTLTVTGTEDNGVDSTNYRDRLDGFEHGPAGGKHAVVITGADHGQIGGGDTSDAAINGEVAAAMTTFLDAYAKDDAGALAALADVEGYADAHPLVAEIYQKSVPGQAGLGALRGGAGGDHLEGLSTHDVIVGRAGDDVLIGQSGDDRLNSGTGDDWLDGGAGADTLNGGDGNDRLIGRNGNDRLIAGAGNDTVNGGTGDDRIEGGAGRDRLTGFTGADRFVFAALSESAVGASRDIIADFSGTQGDRIDVSQIDARANAAGNNAFGAFIGAAAFSAEGQIRAYQSGFSTVIEFNTSGAGGAEMQIELTQFLAFNLALSDFVL